MIRPVLALFLACAGGFAQAQHVAWSVDVTPSPAAPGGKALVRIAAKVDPGWHVYSGSSAGGIERIDHEVERHADIIS